MSYQQEMKLISAAILFLASNAAVSAQLQLVPEPRPLMVFGGGAAALEVGWRNLGSMVTNAHLSVRVSQLSSATAVPRAFWPGQDLVVLPGQTVREVVRLDVPTVRAETRFLVQWLAGGSNVIGRTELLVYPTNLLTQLTALAGDAPVGIFDPADALKPLLHSQLVPFQDLIEDGTDKFSGKLAIFGPFALKSQMRASLKDDIQALTKHGVVVVWLMPPGEPALLKPSFYIIREAVGAVVVATHEITTQLAERPEAQLNLLRLAETGLHPTPLALPETENSN